MAGPAGEEKPVEKTEEKAAEGSTALVEKEKDAPADKRAKLKAPVTFLLHDTTLNAVLSDWGGILATWSEAGLKFLNAGARANVGVKSGRYLFELKVIEDSGVHQVGNLALPKSILRVGFSTTGSPLLLGGEETSAFFETDGGNLVFNGKRIGASPHMSQDTVVGVVLNLDEKSANANTLSLFLDGKRMAEPQPLPQALKGKVLFPTVTYRAMTVSFNFGPTPLHPLAFTCTMLGAAAEKDTQVAASTSKGGELLLPVCIPGEGAFDWCDDFLAKHPEYVELSDRKIIEWAVKSGLPRKVMDQRGTSHDKPVAGFGLPGLDDGAALSCLQRFAVMQQRNYVIMEVAKNLVKDDRKTVLEAFSAGGFKKVACVVMGEPSADFKKLTRDLTLKDKQDEIQGEQQRKKMEVLRKKTAEKRVRDAERNKKKVQKMQQKQLAEKKRKLDVAKAAQERAKKKAKGEEVADEPEPEKAEESAEEPAEQSPKEEDIEMEPAPEAVLTEEDQKAWFRKAKVSDMSQAALCSLISKVTFPEKDEGFDEVRCAWGTAEKSQVHLKKWIVDRKRLIPVEDIVPSDWFRLRQASWLKEFATWKAAFTQAKAAKSQALVAAAKKKLAEKQPKGKASTAAFADSIAAVQEAQEAAMDPAKVLKEEMTKMTFDVFGVEDVNDAGDGTGAPLFLDWDTEDWSLLALRFELHLLIHAFNRDCQDPDRQGIRPEHLAFYYQKYYRKNLMPKNFGLESLEALLEHVDDTIVFRRGTRCLDSVICEDHDSNQIFVKLVEENRRVRVRREHIAPGESSKPKEPQKLLAPADEAKRAAILAYAEKMKKGL